MRRRPRPWRMGSGSACPGLSGAPWLSAIDPGWFHRRLDDLLAPNPTVVASCHGPALRRDTLTRAVELYRQLPGSPLARPVEQTELEELLRIHHPRVAPASHLDRHE